jgi:hypothetical protein
MAEARILKWKQRYQHLIYSPEVMAIELCKTCSFGNNIIILNSGKYGRGDIYGA